MTGRARARSRGRARGQETAAPGAVRTPLNLQLNNPLKKNHIPITRWLTTLIQQGSVVHTAQAAWPIEREQADIYCAKPYITQWSVSVMPTSYYGFFCYFFCTPHPEKAYRMSSHRWACALDKFVNSKLEKEIIQAFQIGTI